MASQRTTRTTSVLLILLLLTAGQCVSQEPSPASDAPLPRTVDEAAQILKTKWLSTEDLDWILRNRKDVVAAELHFPFGMGVRNTFKLWGGGNPELLASCGVRHPDDWSWKIIERLWELVRADANPVLVQRLDCQFGLSEKIQITYKGFYALRIGEVLKKVQDQIDRQSADKVAEPAPACEPTLRLHAAGEPDLSCWVRAEFSEDGRDPIGLEQFLGWFAWRNGFKVQHTPPEITLAFHEKCAWPERPTGEDFEPPEVRGR